MVLSVSEVISFGVMLLGADLGSALPAPLSVGPRYGGGDKEMGYDARTAPRAQTIIASMGWICYIIPLEDFFRGYEHKLLFF